MREETGGQLIKNLYNHPEIYARVFPVDEEEVRFFATLAGECGGPILDAAGGTGGLAMKLAPAASAFVIPVDSSSTLLRGAPAGVVGDLFSLPIGNGRIAFASSRLFGYAYALAQDPGAQSRLVMELARVLRERGRFALELALAPQPHKLQGIAEHTQIGGELSYEFQYLDIIRRTDFGTLIHTTITVSDRGDVYRLQAPLHVFTAMGARAWLAQASLCVTGFCASYDLKTHTQSPPADCLRGVVLGVRE
ncbi:class I SAM-dependent methyltransferase [Candidatus Sumerlaeota bacterium]|nr:class I SAM-dependent methyltransferase [Candidatus Sumerlaeota bacterium]